MRIRYLASSFKSKLNLSFDTRLFKNVLVDSEGNEEL